MAMKQATKDVFNYIKDHDGEDFTAKDIAEALDMNVKSVNGSITSFQRKGYVERVEAEMELADGTHEKVKLIRMTPDGRAFDPDAEAAE